MNVDGLSPDELADGFRRIQIAARNASDGLRELCRVTDEITRHMGQEDGPPSGTDFGQH